MKREGKFSTSEFNVVVVVVCHVDTRVEHLLFINLVRKIKPNQNVSIRK